MTKNLLLIACTMLLGNGFFRDPYIMKLNQLSNGTAETNTLTEVTAYPNPTTGLVTLQMQNSISQITSVEVLNTSGQIIYSEQIFAGDNESLLSLDLTSFADGIYFLKLSGDDSSEVIRIAKQQ